MGTILRSATRWLSLAGTLLGAAATLAACGGDAPAHQAHPVGGYRPDVGDLVAYVANTYDETKAGVVLPVCLQSRKVLKPIPVGGQPFIITIAPDGRSALVANSGWGAAAPQTTVTPVDLSDDVAGPAIEAGLGPMGIAITPDGRTAYVGDMGIVNWNHPNKMVDADTVTPIDLATGRALAAIDVGPGVGAVTLTPDGKEMLVAIDGTLDHPLAYVVIVNLRTMARTKVPVDAPPMGIAVTPDGSEAFVTNTGLGAPGDTVTPIDLRTDRRLPSIPAGRAPIDIVLTDGGRRALVTDSYGRSGGVGQYGTVSTIDVTTRRAGRPITVYGIPQSVALTPDGRTAYVVGMESFEHSALTPVDVATGRVGTPIQFPYMLGAVAVARAPAGLCG